MDPKKPSLKIVRQDAPTLDDPAVPIDAEGLKKRILFLELSTRMLIAECKQIENHDSAYAAMAQVHDLIHRMAVEVDDAMSRVFPL